MEKNIYCMSFKWLQTPEIRKELGIVQPEAGIKIYENEFRMKENSYSKCAWNILNNYDSYGFPSTNQLEVLSKTGNKVYGSSVKIEYSETITQYENGVKDIKLIQYWGKAQKDKYFSKDTWIEVEINNVPLLAVPYDVHLKNLHGEKIGKVRFWAAVTKENYELDEQRNLTIECWEALLMPKTIMEVLFPPQIYIKGKEMCLTQKYFMVSATVQWAIQKHMEQCGNIRNFHEDNQLLLCDEWSGLAIPELIRILQGEYGLCKADAWKIAEQSCVYEMENPEKNLFEVWAESTFLSILPEIYQIIIEFNER